MANPNIVNVTSIYGRTISAALTTASSTLLSPSSGTVRKINSITVANKDGTNDADVTVYALIDGNVRYLAYAITVPAKSTLVVSSKDTSFYLEEADILSANGSASNDLDIIVSYDEIS
jgi:hypothetical protein